MLSAFFDIQGPLSLEFKEPDVSSPAQRYTQTLDKLHKAIENKRPDMLSSGVIILPDNSRPHITKVDDEALVRKKGEVLEHPAYSPDLSPYDFAPLMKSLIGQRFHSEEDKKAAVLNWFHD
ncbi:histone-lysine N-methyltransferase SETMAR [Trichonephila clavata]|uniref:Histone-lysine N-methyltransferase SETMAR n=1 Tax=Trichonephila clavata TaxID=2740835 RepID=A0A8X6FYB1_TRICU|nr:histone-lysine N-methyltransferase SETMAR [Trichonephila clavata]